MSAQFRVGQTYTTLSDTRRIVLVERNAAGETLIGYQGEGETALRTEAEFAAWVRDEVGEGGVSPYSVRPESNVTPPSGRRAAT